MSADIPLSWPLAVSKIPAEGLDVEVTADEAALAALAAANEVEAVKSLKARFELKPLRRDGVTVRGRLEAVATRLCVVSLEPFDETVQEEIDLRLAPDGTGDPTNDDDPDPLEGDVVDLGAIASEFFTIGLDPHPRKPGVAFEQPDDPDGSGSPFAALKKLTGPEGSKS